MVFILKEFGLRAVLGIQPAENLFYIHLRYSLWCAAEAVIGQVEAQRLHNFANMNFNLVDFLFIGQRERTTSNAALLDAMKAYDDHDYAKAAEGLRAVIDKQDDDPAARMYLASALLGAGDPYKAEMHLDFLERAANQSFKDQVEWYNALCWLCSGQNDRAIKQCEWISSQPHHTYREEAHALYVTLIDK